MTSWNAGKSKQAIIAFVERLTDPTAADFVPPSQRIAVFTNDGTLWSEQPMYVQLAFVLDRIRMLANAHSEWE
ncbi:MAG: hypothetical protein KF752_07640 [Pirellulaceae bacterium]|nr:hypothetical protein [Pirellulaceae bacterium]